MKALKLLVILVWGFFLIPSSFAGSGKAIVSHWYAYNPSVSHLQHSNIFISNITAHALKVAVTFYNKDGSLYTSGLIYNNFQNGNTEIAAGNSVNLKITSTNEAYGYAVIEWENLANENDVVGLVAWADWAQEVPFARGFSIQVNNGNPF